MKGGVISIESAEGYGSTFTVDFPFHIAEDVPTSRKERDLHGLHVLVVGSVPPRSEAIDAYIRDRGGDVTAMPTLDAVIAAVTDDRSKFDSVMLDFGLDAQRQQQAVAALRQAGVAPAVMILLQDYQHRSARIAEEDVVTVDANPLLYYRLVSAVAVAAGRASPQIKNELDAAKLKPVKPPTPDEAAALGQLILLAEDNPTNQDVIRRQLNLLGRACEIVDNGQEALDAYGRGRYALILTDCHMPVMDGYELTGRIRGLEQDSGGHIPIVAVTANALQGEAERCIAAGMDDYVSKPIAMPALIATLEKWLPAPRTAAAPVPVTAPASTNGAGTSGAVDARAIKDMFGDDPCDLQGDPDLLPRTVAPDRRRDRGGAWQARCRRSPRCGAQAEILRPQHRRPCSGRSHGRAGNRGQDAGLGEDRCAGADRPRGVHAGRALYRGAVATSGRRRAAIASQATRRSGTAMISQKAPLVIGPSAKRSAAALPPRSIKAPSASTWRPRRKGSERINPHSSICFSKG
jgi:CheY-like chemotaxis protein